MSYIYIYTCTCIPQRKKQKSAETLLIEPVGEVLKERKNLGLQNNDMKKDPLLMPFLQENDQTPLIPW